MANDIFVSPDKKTLWIREQNAVSMRYCNFQYSDDMTEIFCQPNDQPGVINPSWPTFKIKRKELRFTEDNIFVCSTKNLGHEYKLLNIKDPVFTKENLEIIKNFLMGV
jgi:hypothetical protein